MSALLEVSGVSDLSFTIGPAELRAIIGPNGAGKTTFMDIVTGKTRPDSGTVTFGERLTPLIGMEANLILALKANRSPWAVLFWKPKASDLARVGELAQEVGLADHLHRKSGELSHGQKQWLEIAMLLAQEPRLLLVDEPAAGMTPAEREQTTALLVSLAKTRAVVVVEHDMEFIRRLNCRVTVLHEGSVLAEGSLDHVTRDPQVIAVYLGRG